MEAWIVKDKTKVTYNGRELQPGDTFQATKEQLDAMGLASHVESAAGVDKADKAK